MFCTKLILSCLCLDYLVFVTVLLHSLRIPFFVHSHGLLFLVWVTFPGSSCFIQSILSALSQSFSSLCIRQLQVIFVNLCQFTTIDVPHFISQSHTCLTVHLFYKFFPSWTRTWTRSSSFMVVLLLKDCLQ